MNRATRQAETEAELESMRARISARSEGGKPLDFGRDARLRAKVKEAIANLSPEQREQIDEQGGALLTLSYASGEAEVQAVMPREIEKPRRVDTRKERPDREGTRMLAAHFDPDVYRDFKILAAEQGQNTNVLMNKAVELLFESFGRKPPKALRKKLATHGL